ncbi:uncharacterized protein [Notamacropus eugenii]|uniref:uncharacterized protein n=1 Tax=Notamacropus eugenii TaxID=9315 RepID=UPI003B67FEA7
MIRDKLEERRRRKESDRPRGPLSIVNGGAGGKAMPVGVQISETRRICTRQQQASVEACGSFHCNAPEPLGSLVVWGRLPETCARENRAGTGGGGVALCPWAPATIKLQLPAADHQRQTQRNQPDSSLHCTSSERPKPWIRETAPALLEALATVLVIANAKSANALPARKEAALPAALLSVLSVPRSVLLAKGMTRVAAAIEGATGFV